MNRDTLIQKIKQQAKRDKKNRRDRRFLEAMGFLVAKGFLKTNLEMPWLPNKRLRIDDAVWAGQNVEPRILEVLPAAVLRLRKHFDLDPGKHKELARVVAQLHGRQTEGDDFYEIPYAKVKIWAELPLLDKRVKSVTQKKLMKTFRLDPTALDHLRKIADSRGSSETEVLEKLILRAAET